MTVCGSWVPSQNAASENASRFRSFVHALRFQARAIGDGLKKRFLAGASTRQSLPLHAVGSHMGMRAYDDSWFS